MSNNPIALKTVELAEAFADAGTTEEGGANAGAQVERFLASVGLERGNPWCAAFVRHCLEKAAGFLQTTLPTTFPDSGYTPDWEQWARKNDAWITIDQARDGFKTPQRGDLACFYFPAKGRIAHIGIVRAAIGEKSLQGGVLTVEGNTGPDTRTRDKRNVSTVNRDGDGVYKKARRWSQLGAKGGFIRLRF